VAYAGVVNSAVQVDGIKAIYQKNLLPNLKPAPMWRRMENNGGKPGIVHTKQ
jgi:hypothetical protein